MNVGFNQITLLSFYQWLDNYLLQNAQGYTNATTPLYYQPDPQLGAGYVTYAAPYRSWVWDSGVSGAAICNTITGSFGGLSRGQSGMMTDFVNGRVILPASFGTAAAVTGTYAFKDFNLYFSNQSQEQMVFSNKYYQNPRFGAPPTGPVPTVYNKTLGAYDMVTPAIFVTNANSDNKPFALGGLYNTTYTISLNILAETPLQLESVLAVITDAQDKVFPLVQPSQWPLGFYGDYKPGGGYNYQTILNAAGAGGLFTIAKVKASKVSDYAKVDESVWLGICDCLVTIPRLIH